MKYGLKLIIILSLSLGILDSVSFADPKPREEDDSSPYMLGLSRTDNINSTSTIRVKIFPHEKDYLPQGRDEITDHFTIRSEYPCTIFRADKSVIIAGGLISKGKNNISFRAKDLAEAVIVDCPESFTLERNPNEPKKNFSYSGLVYIHVVKKQEQSSLEAINVVSLRGYLRGVVPSEVYPNWPIETLKTQAVAARTYAVYHLVHARRYVPQRLWDVDDTIMYQAYTGISHRSERTDAAVFATDGQILMCKGQVIQAFYHAESGGSTEEASTVWQQAAPFTVARSEASDVEMSHSAWEKSIKLSELTAKLQESGEWPGSRNISKVVVPLIGQTTSGRVKAVTLIDQKGEFIMIPNKVFRRMMGGLQSNLYTIQAAPKTGEILVKGLGNGHGVGMSQQGAAALAEHKSWNYQQILEYYYVRTSLCSLDTTGEDLPDCARESFKYSKQVAMQASR